jgi:colicin import membrane protein
MPRIFTLPHIPAPAPPSRQAERLAAVQGDMDALAAGKAALASHAAGLEASLGEATAALTGARAALEGARGDAADARAALAAGAAAAVGEVAAANAAAAAAEARASEAAGRAKQREAEAEAAMQRCVHRPLGRGQAAIGARRGHAFGCGSKHKTPHPLPGCTSSRPSWQTCGGWP